MASARRGRALELQPLRSEGSGPSPHLPGAASVGLAWVRHLALVQLAVGEWGRGMPGVRPTEPWVDESQGRGWGWAVMAPLSPINSPTSSSQDSLLAWRAVRLLRAPSWLARTGSRGPSRCFLTLPSSRLAAGILCEPTAASTLTRHCRRTQGGTAVWSPTQPAPSTGMWSWSSTVSPGPRGDGGGVGDREREGSWGGRGLECLCLKELRNSMCS